MTEQNEHVNEKSAMTLCRYTSQYMSHTLCVMYTTLHIILLLCSDTPDSTQHPNSVNRRGCIVRLENGPLSTFPATIRDSLKAA